ncbi:MAG TPA: tetratricopeptide repeat protein [Myxococcaceae bacterium]|nr:tetratricopeptide repeat protein [Myxococcaceae bacterium]
MPRTARAQGDFDRYLNSAVQLYESGENEDALEQLQRARKLAQGIQQDVAVALHEGLILADMGKTEQSRAAFRRGLTLDPEAQLPIKVGPKVEQSFEEVRKSVKDRLARGGTKPPPPPPPPPAPEPKETKPPVVAGTDRPEKAPEPPKRESSVVPAPTPAPYTPTAEARERSRVPVVPLVLGGVGIAAAGVGTFFGLQSRSNLGEVEDRLAAGSVPSQSEASAVRAQLDDARGQARIANVLFGTAAAAVTGAIVTYLFSGDDTKADTREER